MRSTHIIIVTCIFWHFILTQPLHAGTSPTTTHTSTPTTKNVIIASSSDLMYEFSEITDPRDFSLSVRMKPAHFKQLIINDGNDTRTRE